MINTPAGYTANNEVNIQPGLLILFRESKAWLHQLLADLTDDPRLCRLVM